jgi:enediyne biosynthesis protein E5
MDPRLLQLGTLGGLLLYGLLVLDFEVQPGNALAIFATSQLAQWAGDRRSGRRYDPRSALCLLLRTSSPLVAAFAAALAIGSKSLIRVDGKHVFNPANFGIVAAVVLTGEAWISPGQWGSTALAALFFAGLGTTVVQRSERADVTFAFLGFYALLLFGRSAWLGEPSTIPLHRLQSGALLLFAFFMISDPKTTPNARGARILYAALVAGVAYVISFVWFVPSGIIWALFAMAPVVPLLDRWVAADRYHWPGSSPWFRETVGAGSRPAELVRP